MGEKIHQCKFIEKSLIRKNPVSARAQIHVNMIYDSKKIKSYEIKFLFKKF